uniref:Uncharacterized protein n=1 Tax=Mustela putorius furo TaxID=9669 RepID=M3XWZ4_MUSPF
MGQFPALLAWPALPQPAPGSFHAGHDVIPCGVRSWAGGKAPSTHVEPHCGPKRQLGQGSLSPLQRGRAQTPDSSSARATVRRRNGASSGWREHLVTSPPFRCSFLPETAKGLSNDLALSRAPRPKEWWEGPCPPTISCQLCHPLFSPLLLSSGLG